MEINLCKHNRNFSQKDHFKLFHRANIYSGNTTEFLQHHHSFCEIYIYLNGKANFFLEGTTFSLNPYDIIIVPPYTLHQPQPQEGEMFERIILNVLPNFYQHMNCTEYENIFANLSYLTYKIPGHVVKRSNFVDFIDFILDDYDKNNTLMMPLLQCKIVELLYHINTTDKFEKYDSINHVAQDIISYIDENFKSISKIEDVSSNFFYSKNHLAYIFKKQTGITISRYINIKKLENIEKLYKQGHSLTYACIDSGFSNYDKFAYIYKKEFGVSPKKGFSTITKTTHIK